MSDEPQQGQEQQGSSSSPETKGHESPAVAARGEGGDVAAGHQAPETRGHQPPSGGQIELGYPSPEGVVIVQSVGEMHSPATEAPPPTAAPPKPADAAQSVRPPQARQEETPPSAPPLAGGEGQQE